MRPTGATRQDDFDIPPEQPQSATFPMATIANPIHDSEQAEKPAEEPTDGPIEASADNSADGLADEPALFSAAGGDVSQDGPADIAELGVSRQPVDVSPFTESADDARQEQYRALAQRLRAECEPLGLRSVLLIGIGDESELADVAASLAAALSREARVLLVDGDLRDQRLTKAWRHTATPGLARALDEDRTAIIPVVPTTTAEFDFLPAGQPRRSIRRDDAKLLGDSLREFAVEYKTILIDGGCLPAMPTELLAEVSDATFVVIQLGQTETDDVKAVVRQVRELGGRVLGCIATNAPPAADHHA
jgi:Mrp family chromosome partitioning ATPase